MGDITYESLMAARTAKAEPASPEFDIMGMANLALGILEQVNKMKGGGDNILQTRPPAEGTAATTQAKPTIDVEQILGALKTVKSLKGDLKITELEVLLKEHKEQVTQLLGKL